jgi:type I restriction enzyme S subunit
MVMSEQLMLDIAEVGLDVPQGYKKTEVGVIPEDWNLVVFGSTITTLKGGANLSPYDFVSIGIPVVPKSAVTWGARLKIREAEQQFCRENSKSKFISNIVDRSYTIIVLRDLVPSGPNIGLVVEIEDNNEYLLAQGVYGFKLKPDFHPAYFAQLSNSSEYRKIMKSILVGSTQVHIRSSSLKETSFPFPPSLKEQTAIATALSDVDALMNELEQLIAKKQAIKTATMQQLLTGRTRLPQFALRDDGTPKGYKASELGEIPEDWDTKKMGELSRIQRGASPRPIDSPIWFDRTSSVGWLRISDVSKTVKYLTETTQNLSELGIANSRFVSQGNLVMSICATVGKPIITSVNLCIHDGFVVFNGLSVIQDYMYYILKKLEPEWSKQGQTGSQMNLNTELINTTLVLIPQSQAEQTAIATILSDMDSDISNLQQRLSKARQIKQGMMQQLLTGHIRLI